MADTHLESIQRVLFICAKVHVYQIPPLTSIKGYQAASWTSTAAPTAQQIFTARLRILETSLPASRINLASQERPQVQVLLEDPGTGELFAAAPYDNENVVQSAIDSSRFFAIRVVGDGNMKATLGLGFEERSEAIDFGICLQECRKIQNDATSGPKSKNPTSSGQDSVNIKERKDWSLKEGEMIKVNLGRKGRVPGEVSQNFVASEKNNNEPEANSRKGMPMIAPPPTSAKIETVQEVQDQAKELGFDDGEFGEFQ